MSQHLDVKKVKELVQVIQNDAINENKTLEVLTEVISTYLVQEENTYSIDIKSQTWQFLVWSKENNTRCLKQYIERGEWIIKMSEYFLRTATEIKKLNKKIKDQAKTIEKSSNDANEWANRLEGVHKNIQDQLEKEIVRLNGETEGLTQEKDQLKQLISRLNGELTQKTKGLNQATRQLTQEIAGLNQATRQLTQEKDQLKQANLQLTQKTEGLNQANLQLTQEIKGLNQANLQLTQKTEGLNQANLQLTQEIKGLNQANLQLTEEKRDLEQSLEIERVNWGDIKECTDYRAQNMQLNQKITDILQENGDLEKKLQECNKKVETEKMKTLQEKKELSSVSDNTRLKTRKRQRIE